MATGAISTTTPMLTVRDPARGTVVDELPIDDAGAVAAAVSRARAAQPAWAALSVFDAFKPTSPSERQSQLLALFIDHYWQGDRLMDAVRQEGP